MSEIKKPPPRRRKREQTIPNGLKPKISFTKSNLFKMIMFSVVG